MSTTDLWYYFFEAYTALPGTTTTDSLIAGEWSKYVIAVNVVNKLIHYIHKDKTLYTLPFSRILRIDATPLEFASSQTIGNPRAALTICVIGQRLGESIVHPHRLDIPSDRDQLVNLINAYVSCDISIPQAAIPQLPVTIHRGPGRKSGAHFASSRYLVVVPHRLLVFRSETSTLPLHAIYLMVDMERKGDKKLLLRSREREYTFIWKNQTEREVWYSLLEAEAIKARQLEISRDQNLVRHQKQLWEKQQQHEQQELDDHSLPTFHYLPNNPSTTQRLSNDFENDKEKPIDSRRTSLTSSSISQISRISFSMHP